LKHQGYHSSGQKGTALTAVGVDVGATLAKLATRRAGEPPRFALVAADALEQVARAVREAEPGRVGLTGGGAPELARLLGGEVARVNEFAAWGSGASALLEREGLPRGERHLLVSVGTGTSVMLVDGLSVTRIGGTALGGGTVVGLGSRLTGTRSFAEIAELASRGARRRVDLRVSDIYRAGEIPLAGELTAASFGRLGRTDLDGEEPRREDLAHALMGLVGENVALICGGLAAAAQVRRIVFGGSTLRGNPALVEVLREITSALGREPTFLCDGEFAGSLGALLLAADGS
jgi:type II pantothenate kinase